MPNISVISKESHQVLENVNSSKVGLNENSVVVVQVSKDDVASITRENNNALITLRNGEVIVVENYFNAEFSDNSLVFQDESGQLYWVKFTNTDGTIAETILYYPIEEIEPLLYSDNFVGGILPWLVGAGVAGIAAAAGGGGDGGGSTPTPPVVNALPAPKVFDNQEPKTGEVANGESTNDQDPTISGSGAQPGATIKVYDGDVLIGETVAKEDGTWEFVPTTPLVEGQHNISVTQTVDGQESPKSPVADFTVDTQAPNVTVDSLEATNDTTPEITGTTELGATVDVVIKDKDGNPVAQGPATVNPDGTWTYTPTDALPEGEYTVEATAKDPAGNEATVDAPVELVIDTTAPTNVTIDPIDLTNDSTPELTGTTEPGSTVQVTITDANGKVVTGPATVNPDGTWTYTPSEPLAEGEQDVVAVATDKAGNTAQATEDFVVDFSGPEISIDPIDETNDTTPEITGTTEPGSTVDVVVKDKDGNPVAQGPATVNPDGTWTYTPTTELPEGDYKVEAVAKDDKGNPSAPATENFEVDTTGPEVSVNPLPETNDTTPEVTGTTEPGSTVDVVIKDKDGNPVAEGTATVNPDGTWSYTPTEELPEGEYTVEATAKDPAGNETDATPEELVIDTTPPAIAIDELEDTNDTTPEITGTTELGATVDVVIKDKDGNPVAQGPATVNPDGTWTYTPTDALPEGEYTVEATAKDPAGNEATVDAPVDLVIDTTAPTNVTIDPIDLTNDSTPELTGTTEPGSTVQVTITDANGKVVTGPATVNPDGTWTYTPSDPLAEGEQDVVAVATDKAGNTAQATEDFVVDFSGPEISIDPIAETNDTTPEITGTTEPGSTVDVVVKDKDGNPVAQGPATVNPDGTWTYTPTTELPEGDYTVEAVAKDDKGNPSAPATENFEVDTTGPEVSVNPLPETNDTTPEVTGTTEPGSTVDVVIKDKDGNPVAEGTATVNPDGTWSYTPTEELPEDEYTVEATAKDPVGNETDATPEELVIDTTPPAIEIDPPVVTNDTTPEVTGKTEPGSTVDVVIKDKDGNPVAEGTATVNPDGSWTYTPTEELPEGEYTVDATSKDPAGNETDAPTEELAIDTTPPIITIDPPIVTNDTTPEIKGETEPGSTVDVVIKDKDGNPVAEGTATVNPDGSWTYTPTEDLPEGEYTIDATSKDPAGNEKKEEGIGGLVIDTTPGGITIDPPDNGDDDDWWNTFQQSAFTAKFAAFSLQSVAAPEKLLKAETSVAFHIKNPAYVFTGETKDNVVRVELEILDKNGNVVSKGPATTFDLNTDKWTYNTGVKLADGEYTLIARGYDNANNLSVDTLDVIVDTIAPPVDVVDYGLTNDSTPTFTGTTEPGVQQVAVIVKNEAGQQVQVQLVTPNADGTWSFTPNELADGKYTIEAKARDLAGNVTPVPGVAGVIVDTTPPPIAIDDQDPTQDTTPAITGTTEPGATVDVVIKDKDGNPVAQGPATVNPDGTWTYTPTDALPEGEYTVEATAKDPAGNEATVDAPVDLVIDTTAPTNVTVDAIDLTNDSTPEITGTTEPGTTVQVTVTDVNGKEVSGPATVNPDGTWTFTPSEPLAEGEQKVVAVATDEAGNTAQATEDFVVDTVPPAVAIDPIEDTNDTTPEVTGTTEPGATVDVVIKDKDGNPVAQGPATVNPDGTWTYTPTDALPEGEYTVEATAKDPAGNEATVDAPVDLVIDTTAPTNVTVDAIDLTNDSTPEITGTTEPGTTVQVTVTDVNGKEVSGPATVNPDGTWTFTPSEPLAEGEQKVVAVATDEAGNTAQATEDFVVDTVPPAVAIDPIEDTNDTTPEVTGTTEPGATVDVVIKDKDGNPVAQGPATVNPDGTWTYTPTDELPEGEYTVEATAKDPAGNEATVDAPVDLVIDTSPTTVSIDPIDLTNDSTPEITGTTEPGTTVQVTVTDVNGKEVSGPATVNPDGTWTFTPSEPLAEGEQKVVAVATDKAGNTAQATEDFVVDTVPPAVAIDPIEDTNDTTPEITGTTEPGATVDVVIKDKDGNPVVQGPATVNPDGTWTYTPTDALPEGEYTVEATAKDPAGNEATVDAPVDLVIDTTAPTNVTVDAIDLTNDSTPEITGTTEPGTTVQVTVTDVNGKEVSGPATVNPDGTWTFTPSEPLAEGEQKVVAVATDKAGNTAQATEDFVVDTVPPAVAIDPIEDTNDTTPEVTGTTEPGATVDVVIKDKDGNPVAQGPATVNPDGTWTYTPTDELPEGEYTVEATAKDPAGNEATVDAPVDLVIDTTLPVVTIDPIDTTNDTTPEITGKTEPGTTVDVVIKDQNGNPVAQGPATVNPDGTWSYTPTAELPEGDFTVEATATDSAGNAGKATEDFTVDVAGPTVTIDSIDETNDTTPEITGTTDPDSSVNVVIKDENGQVVAEGPATVNPDGTWSFTPTTELPEGDYSIEAIGTDAIGNKGEPATEDFVVDTTAPIGVSIDAIDDTNDNTPTITGKTEPGTSVVVSLTDENGKVVSGPATVNPDGTWTFTSEVLADGKQNVVAVATDKAGNTAQATEDFIVDTIGPDIDVYPVSLTDEINDKTPEFTGKTEPGAKVDLVITHVATGSVLTATVYADAEGNFKYVPFFEAPEGDYTVTGVATDKLGNKGAPDSEQFRVDVTPPTNVSINPIDDTNDTTPEITGTTEVGSSVQVTITDENGKVVTGAATVNPDGTWTFTPSEELAEGKQDVVAVASDKAGNTAQATEEFEVDFGGPEISIDPIDETNDTTPTITGKTEPGSTVDVVVKDKDGNPVAQGPATVNPDGTWTYTPTTELPEGEYTVEAVAKDKLGNPSDPATEDFEVDTTAPAVSIDPVDVTNDTTPEVTGTTEPGSTVDVVIKDKDGNPVAEGTATVNPDGTWTYTPTEELPEGEYTVEATAKDPAGNETDATPEELVIDTTPPAIAIDELEETNDTTPEITGTTEPGATVDVVIKDKDGNPVAQGPATVNPDGTWTYTPTTELPEGEYTVEATAKDPAGNEATVDAPVDLVIDTTAPTNVTIDAIDLTNDSTPELTGTTEPGSTVQVTITDANGKVVTGPATVNPDGTWTYTPSEPLAEGEQDVVAVATDKAGNTAQATEEFTVDFSGPEISIDPIAETNDTTPEITGKTEPGSTVDVVVKDKDGNPVAQGPATVNPDGTWTYTPTTELPEGEYTVEATAKDGQGNPSEPATEDFEVDTTAPAVSIDPLDETNDTTPEVTGTTEPGSTVDVVIKDKDGNPVAEGTATVNPDGTWSYTPTEELAEGEYTVEATAKDPAGNETDATPEELVIDTTSPLITIDPPVETNDTTPEVTGKTEPGSTVDVVIKDKDGNPVAEGTATVNPDGSWTYTPTEELPEGEYTVDATSKDPAGNETDAPTEELVIDTTPPVITIDPPVETNDTTPEVTGKTEPGSTVDVVIKDKDGNPVAEGTATVNPDGSWTYTPTEDLPEGEYTVDATSKDPAGNETDAPTEELVIDTTPPVITIDPPVETNDTTPELTGEVEPGSTVEVEIKDKDGNTVDTGTATVNPDGSWTYTPTEELPEGEYTVDATAKDPAGNEQPTGPVDLVVDTTPPEITIDPIGDAQYNATNDPQHPITGTGEPGTTVTLTIVGTKLGYKEEGIQVTVGQDGKWSYVPPVKLAEDIYEITGVPSDAAGNVGTAKSETFELDTTPPGITIDPPDNGDDDDWWNSFSAAATASEPVLAPAMFAAPMMARMAFSAPVVEPVVASVQTTSLSSTALNNALNLVGNAVTSEPTYFVKSKEPTFTGKLMDGAVAVDVVIVRDADGNLIETGPAIIVDGISWSYTVQNPLADGVYQIEAVGRDLSGNPSAPASLIFEVDTVLPEVEIFDSVPTNDVTPTITGVTSEPTGTVDIVILQNGQLVDRGSATVDPVTGHWSFTTNVDLADGTYVVQAQAKDKAGNAGRDTNSVTVDLVAPDAPVGSFNEDGSVLEGTAQAGSTVTYKGPNGEILTTQADETTGSFKFEFNPAIDQGQQVTLTATDVGGTSAPTTVNAPYVTHNNPADDVAQAFIDYDHPVTERFIDNAICYSWKFGLFGYVIGRDSGSTTFEIGKGKHADIELQIKTGSLKAIFDQVKLVLSKYNPTNGVWEKVASNSDSGLFDFLGFFGEKATVKVNDLEAGKYRIDMESWSAITKFGYVETDIVIREVDANFKVEVSEITDASGNVLANDVLDGTSKLTEVDGVAVTDAGVTINGNHGTLTIKADGSYVYKPSADLTNIGKTEVFEYTITDANGKTTTADLIVQIGTNSGIDLTWDPTDPAKPATTNLSVSDDVNSAQTTVKKAADTVQSLVCGSACSAAYYGGKKVDGVSKLAIQSLAEGTTAKIAIKSTLACSQTITGDKFSYQVQYKDSAGNWVNASGAGASGSVVGNGFKYAGTTLFNTSYQADSALSKQWQVVFTTSEAAYSVWGSNSTMINTYVQATVSSDKLVTEGVNKAVGNVITDDTGFGADKLASKDDQLFVKNPNTGKFELATGDVISVDAGKLVLNQDGSYVFTPAANATAADVEFEYKLVAPNGVEKSATLTIDLGKAFVSSAASDTVALGEGADKIIFNVLNSSDNTGGNGHDTWTDFKAENNDKIDISKLLQGDVNSGNIDQYVSVNKVGNDTVISIDRDGSGTNYAKADLITLKNTDTTLQDLLNNNNVLY